MAPSWQHPASTFAPPPHESESSGDVCVLCASATGRTARVAERVVEELGPRAELIDACDLDDPLALGARYPGGLVVGAPTWATAAAALRTGTPLDDALWTLRRAAAAGERPLARVGFAVFGCGDARQWPLNFCDALAEMHATLEAAGGSPAGEWVARDGDYLCEASRSAKAGADGALSFVGLPLDEINQPHLTAERVQRWAAQVRGELSLDGPPHEVGGFDRPATQPYTMAAANAQSADAGVASTARASGEERVAGYAPLLFGRTLGKNWYQLGGEEDAAAGRWVRFDDAHELRVCAGRRGQPEWRIPFRALAGVEVIVEQASSVGAGRSSALAETSGLSDVPVTLAFAVDGGAFDGSGGPGAYGDAARRSRWGRTLVLRGVSAFEVAGLCTLLRSKGARV